MTTRIPSSFALFLAASLASGFLAGCANKSKRANAPLDLAWAQKLDAKLAAKGDRPEALRDRALLASAFLPQSNKRERYAKLKTLDALGAYALATRAMRSHDVHSLLRAAQTMLDAQTQKAAFQPANIAYPATDQVLEWLWEAMQDRPKLQGKVDALFATYEDRSLSPSTRRALYGLVGKSRRLRGQPFRFAYQEQGCLQSWTASEVHGSLGELSLSRAKLKGPWPTQSTAPVPYFPLACAVRVWNPTQDAGYIQLQNDVRLETRGMLLSLSSPAAIRVWVDDQEIQRNDQMSHLASRDFEFYLDLPPGQHRIKVAIAVPGDNEWMVLRATDLAGKPLANHGAKDAPPSGSNYKVVRRDASIAQSCEAELELENLSETALARPWIQHCALSHALSQYDRESTRPLALEVEGFEAFAEGIALLADADLQNPEINKNARRSAANQRLAQAVELDPSLLGLAIALGESRVSRGEEGEVRQELRKAPDPKHVADALFRFGVFLEVGDELQADRMLELAKALEPDHCEVVAAAFRRARDIDARARQAELLSRLKDCPGSRALGLRFWMNRGRYDKARPLADALLQERGDQIEDLFRRIDIAQAQGDKTQVETDLQRILQLQTASLRAHLLLADQARSTGKKEEAKTIFSELVKRFPNENHLRRYLEELGEPDPLLVNRVQGLPLILDYQKKTAKDAPFAKDAAVYLLDRDLVHVYENGAQRHLIHQIVRVQSKEAIDSYGEITVPEDAELLVLRTVKQDGRKVEPERTPGKSSYSMRALEVGDYVEQEWIMPAQWAQANKGSTDLGVFRFASTRAPFVRSELIVSAPKALNLQMETSNGAPKAQIEESATQQTWRFLAENQPRVVPEPSTPSMADLIPQVRGFANLGATQWHDELLATTRDARRRGPELRSKVKTLIQGAKSPKAKLKAIYDFVDSKIEPKGNLSKNVNRALSEGKGNRTNILYAMLQEAKIPARILVARSLLSPKLGQGGHPQFESYDTPIVEVWPDSPKSRQYIVPELSFAPIGYLPEWFDGSVAYPLNERGAAQAALRLDKGNPELADRQRYHLKIELDAQGNASVDATIRIYGVYAAQWREALKRSDPERHSEIFSQYELPRFFTGKSPRLESLTIDHQRDREKPLTMRARLSVPQLAKPQSGAQGEELTMSSLFMPLNPGASLVSLAKRELDLRIATSGRQKATIEVKLPQGAQWDPEIGQALTRSVTGSYGDFNQRATVSKGTLLLNIESKLRPQVVSPQSYPDFVTYVRKVAQAQVHRLRASVMRTSSRPSLRRTSATSPRQAGSMQRPPSKGRAPRVAQTDSPVLGRRR